MAFWNRKREPAGESGADFNPGDPHGVEVVGERAAALPFPMLQPSPWSGWPENWATPEWATQSGLQKLIDVAWAAIDLNANILSSFPVYRLRNGQILPPMPCLTNPDDTVYTSWAEFMKQLAWDFQAAGEAFVIPIAHGADGYPIRFRVVPPWLVNIDLKNGSRTYMLGAHDVTDEILHIRNISTTADAHGHSPLEAAGARIVTAGLLQRYANRLAETGGVPWYWLDVPGRRMSAAESRDLQDQWVEARIRHVGEPPVLSGGVGIKTALSMSARDLSLLELAQFSEARVSVICGVPPFLLGLPMAIGESLTYSNSTQLFLFHDRSSLRPKANTIMEALSGWLLPRGQSVELNRDEYSRPDYLERAQANKIYLEAGVLTSPEVRAMERFDGVPSAASALTGAELTSTPPPPPPTTPAAPPTPAPAGGNTP